MRNQTGMVPVLNLHPEVSSSKTTTISLRWDCEGGQPEQVSGYRVDYQHRPTSYVYRGQQLPASVNTYQIKNLLADTYYNVCVSMFLNDSAAPHETCLDISTTSWHIPVSIGSSIGAVLALTIIVIIVLVTRCPAMAKPPQVSASESSKYDSMSSHYPEDSRMEMSEVTHCPEHDMAEDVFSQKSEADSLTESKPCRQCHRDQAESPTEPLLNPIKKLIGVDSQGSSSNSGTVARTLSLIERRHKNRRSRLSHLHNNFHSFQSEPISHPSPSSLHIMTIPHISFHSSLPLTNISPPMVASATTASQSFDSNRWVIDTESLTSDSQPVVIRTSPARTTSSRQTPNRTSPTRTNPKRTSPNGPSPTRISPSRMSPKGTSHSSSFSLSKPGDVKHMPVSHHVSFESITNTLLSPTPATAGQSVVPRGLELDCAGENYVLSYMRSYNDLETAL